jgi:hypothetical protein
VNRGVVSGGKGTCFWRGKISGALACVLLELAPASMFLSDLHRNNIKMHEAKQLGG